MQLSNTLYFIIKILAEWTKKAFCYRLNRLLKPINLKLKKHKKPSDSTVSKWSQSYLEAVILGTPYLVLREKLGLDCAFFTLGEDLINLARPDNLNPL